MGKKYPLSAIDHIFTGVGSYPIEFIFVYEKRIDEKKLKESLLVTVDSFPMIASILVRQGPNAYAFESTPEGLIFSVVNSSINFDENDKKYEYIDPVDTREGNPLTRIKLTHTPNGSVLGVSISHSLADGFSYFHFLSSWSRIFHQKQIFPPVHQRELLNSPENTGHSITKKTCWELTGLFLDEKRIPIPKNDLKWETRIFTQRQIKDLLSGVQQEADLRLSHNDLITSLLAKEYLEDWSIKGGEGRCYINCPVDFRRLLEGFPRTYFGNAVAMASYELSLEALKEIKLADLAGKIRKSIGKVNGQYVQLSISALTSLKEHQGRKIFEHVHVMHPRGGLLVTNLSRLPVQEIEFDAGPPVQYDILTQSVRGAVVLPAREGYEARICCPTDYRS
jgi:shikimate O-hydroxycinnamoyltransferase